MSFDNVRIFYLIFKIGIEYSYIAWYLLEDNSFLGSNSFFGWGCLFNKSFYVKSACTGTASIGGARGDSIEAASIESTRTKDI